MIRNKLIIFAGLICICTAHADTVDYIDMQLDAQINELISRRDKLRSDLEACEKNTRGYKIAGISTLAATGIGVVGNIKLAKEIEEQKLLKGRGGTGAIGGGAGGGKPGTDTRTTEQKINSDCENPDFSCEDLCEFHYECPKCTCSG